MTEGTVPEGPTVLYIMGQDRSGSTILGDILGQAPGVAHVGEVRNVWLSGFVRGGPCGCGRPVPDCEVWSRVPGEVPAAGRPPEVARWLARTLRLRNLGRLLHTPRGAPVGIPEAAAYATLAPELYGALARLTRSRVLVDSSKHPVYAALLGTVPGLDLRLLHLVRDPRATAYSWGREKEAPGGPGGRMWRIPAWRAARAWVLANLAADRVRARHRSRSILLRYEDAIRDPRAAVGIALRHAGLPDVEVPVGEDGTVVLDRQHTGSGNPGRLQGGPTRLREDDAWRTQQRGADRLLVMGITAPFLRRYGYSMARA